jgi:hypothetical protein
MNQLWNVSSGLSSGLFSKDTLLMKNSNLSGTASRFWNNVVLNPGQLVNKEQNSNPLIPHFFYGPKLN